MTAMPGRQAWSHVCYSCRHSKALKRAEVKGQKAKEKRHWRKEVAP